MELSVVVPTLNEREALVSCLDALAAAIDADQELIVVNGPSADGTTGAVRARGDVDVLLELADRNVNVARNAGIEAATGDAVAFVDERTVVAPAWYAAVKSALGGGADAVTGPVGRPGDPDDGAPERRRIDGRTVCYFDGGNVAFARDALERLDGFDEYLAVGGARDAAHRMAAQDLRTDWDAAAAARRETTRDRFETDRWRWKYRSLAYRLAKNYGLKATVVWRTIRHAARDGVDALRGVLAGRLPASRWLADGRDVLAGGAKGALDGLLARRRDPRPARNPNGLSSRSDRAIRRYDWR